MKLLKKMSGFFAIRDIERERGRKGEGEKCLEKSLTASAVPIAIGMQ
jgi:hypothetical protein